MWQLIPAFVGTAVAYDKSQKIGEEGQSLAAEGEADYDLSLQNLTNIAEGVGLSAQDTKLRDTYFQVAEELTNAGVADADEIAQAVVAGIGDSRMEAAALNKLGDLTKGKRDARLEGAMLKLQGETGLTERAAQLADQKTGMLYDIADTRDRDLARINTGMDAYFGAQAAQAELFAAAGNALSSGLITASGTPDQRAEARAQRQTNRASARTYAPTYNPADFAQFGMESSTPGAEILAPGATLDDIYQRSSTPGSEILFPGATLDDIYNRYSTPDQPIYYTGEEGTYIAEGGGVTEGEFNHDTNKKAVIDEESGRKEGELTRGEVVFNPEQTDNIEDFIESRDADGLLAYMTQLFSLPQFEQA